MQSDSSTSVPIGQPPKVINAAHAQTIIVYESKYVFVLHRKPLSGLWHGSTEYAATFPDAVHKIVTFGPLYSTASELLDQLRSILIDRDIY